MQLPTRAHRGVAVSALAVIVVVTVGWWALALYPVGATAPEWLARTRLACFGAAPGGLPNAGGWVLLVGEPIGMLAVLGIAWGNALAADFRWIRARPAGRLVLAAVAVGLALGALQAGRIVTSTLASRDGAASFAVSDGRTMPVTRIPDVPPLNLIDQQGAVFALSGLAGKPVLVTFAFAHCETVCPTVVRQVMTMRESAARTDIPLVVVTVDPWRDVPSRLSAIANGWGMAANDLVLGGEIGRVNDALDRWGVGRSRDETTGDVSHAVLVVLVDADHRAATRVQGDVSQLVELLRRA